MIVVLWIPLMIWTYVVVGFFLVFFPPLLLHWKTKTRRVVQAICSHANRYSKY